MAGGEFGIPWYVSPSIDEGPVLRVRPRPMTVAVMIAGRAPVMWSQGAGAELMHRIAAPVIGGMIIAPLLSIFVFPAGYLLLRGRATKA